MIKLYVTLVLLLVGLVSAASYQETHIVVQSSPSLQGSAYVNADGEQTQSQLGCVGASTIDTIYFENATNETRESAFNCVSAPGQESKLVARFKAVGPKSSWSKSSEWFSRGSDLSVTSEMSANNYNLSTATEFHGNTNLFSQGQTFSDSPLPAATSFEQYSGNISGFQRRLIDLMTVKRIAVEDYLPCTSCLADSAKPTTSYSAGTRVYAGPDGASIEKNTSSTGIVPKTYTARPIIYLGQGAWY